MVPARRHADAHGPVLTRSTGRHVADVERARHAGEHDAARQYDVMRLVVLCIRNTAGAPISRAHIEGWSVAINTFAPADLRVLFPR